jgi:hypothetical protein
VRPPSGSTAGTIDTDGQERAVGIANWPTLPVRLRCALGVAVLGGLLLAIGPLLPVVTPAAPAGFASGPLLFVLGLLPVGVAVVLVARGWAVAASGVLIVAALFTPGRILADAQLAVDGSTAARPELTMPTSLTQLHGSTGLWLILAGQVLTLVAGLLATGLGDVADSTDPAAERAPGSYQGPVLLALAVGAVAAIGLIAAPFTAATPFLLARGALDSPTLVLVGGLLIAVAAPLAATIAVTSADPSVAKGWLLGAAASVLAIALPRVVAGFATDGLHPSWGPYAAVVAALVMAGFGLFADRTVAIDESEGSTDTSTELQLPGQSRLHVATGVFGLVAAGAALIGADTALFTLPPDLPHVTELTGRLLIPAAALVGICAVGMLVPRWASAVRPAFAVVWVAILLAGTAAFDTAVSATQIDGVHIGPGTWATGLSMLAALVAACCAGLAGGVERDDVDLSTTSWQPMVLAPGAAAALLAFGAFGLPILRADGYTSPGIWSDFRFESWGLVLGLAAVVASALLASRCRPKRAVGLLLGAAGVVVVRLLELPLEHGIAPGASAGSALLLVVACLVVLLVTAGIAGWLARQQANRPVPTRR